MSNMDHAVAAGKPPGRERERGFSFKSDRSSGSKPKEHLTESPEEKRRRDSLYKGSSKANPNAAMTEAQPGGEWSYLYRDPSPSQTSLFRLAQLRSLSLPPYQPHIMAPNLEGVASQSLADPVVQPADAQLLEQTTIASLRGAQHLDINGNPISKFRVFVLTWPYADTIF
jgi:hypothetical protein